MSKQQTDAERLAAALDHTPDADSGADLREAIRTADAARKASKPALSPSAVARIERRALNRFRAQKRETRRPIRISFAQWAAAIAIVAALIAASTGTVAASAGSLPGEPLYPVKRFVEKARLSLAPPDQHAALHIAFAEARLAEIEALSSQGDVPPGLIDDLAAETESALTTAQTLPPDKQADVYSTIVNAADHQQAVLTAVEAKVPEPAKAAIAHAQSVSAKGKKQALEAIKNLGGLPPGQGQPPTHPNSPQAATPAPPGQGQPPTHPNAPPGQGESPTRTPPGQGQPPTRPNTPPGQQKTPPGQSGDKGNKGGGKP